MTEQMWKSERGQERRKGGQETKGVGKIPLSIIDKRPLLSQQEGEQ